MYRQFFNPTLRMIKAKLSPHCAGPGKCVEITSTGKFKLMTGHIIDSPWIFVKPARFRRCNLWQFWEEMFPVVDGAPYIPSGCQACWKVVIRPANVYELFMLLGVLQAAGFPSKCGMDFRRHTCQPYGGFVYCDGQPHGREVLEYLRPIIAEQVSAETATKMILKRGCTEFDRKLPSDQWTMPDSHQKLERYLIDMFVPEAYEYHESDATTAFKCQDFILFANSIGDMSWKNVVGDKVQLTVDCVTY